MRLLFCRDSDGKGYFVCISLFLQQCTEPLQARRQQQYSSIHDWMKGCNIPGDTTYGYAVNEHMASYDITEVHRTRLRKQYATPHMTDSSDAQ